MKLATPSCVLALAAAIAVALVGAAGASSARPARPASSLAPTLEFAPQFVVNQAPPVVSRVSPTRTPPLRDIIVVPDSTPPFLEYFEREGPTQAAGPQAPDPAVQRTPGAPDMPAPLLTFDGLGQISRSSLGIGGGLPPDVEGDVGPSHYVEWINGVFSVFSKTGATAAGFPKVGKALFSSLTPGAPCRERNDGDPLVQYDQLADRWVVSQFAVPDPYYQCVAVSTTPDPTGSWCLYPFQVSSTVFNDYGKLAMWPDAYYFSFAGFPDAGGFTPAAYAVERAQMLACGTAQTVYFDNTNNAAISASAQNRMLPADLDGPTVPPVGEPNPFVMHDDVQDQLELYEFHVDWVTLTNSTFTKVADLAVAPFDTVFTCNVPTQTRQCIPQPAPETNRLDVLATRLMYELNYRNFTTHQALVVNQTVDADTDHAGVRWYELRNPHGVPFVHQQSTYAPDANHRWMGSVAMDRKGNLAVGYSISNMTNIFPSIRYAGRLATDPTSVLTQGEATLFTGSGTQTGVGYTPPGGPARWGDYTRMTVDPVDDCTFWYINEYYPVTANDDYVTRIGSFKFPECAAPTAVEVKRFGARWRGQAVSVAWRTVSETRLLGFHVYRSTGAGPFRKVTRALIEAKKTGRATGAVYSFVDRTARRGASYTYRLQLVSTTGKRSWHTLGSAAS